jgi:L-lactate dehydrogenase complex protein LldG
MSDASLPVSDSGAAGSDPGLPEGDAREEVLGRIRSALSEVPDDERALDVPVPRDYDRRGTLSRTKVLELFAERVSDYRASVRRVPRGELAAAVGDACRSLGIQTLAVPSEVPPRWRPPDVQIVEDRPSGSRARAARALGSRELDAIDGVLTGCAVAIAATGTLVLDGQGVCGRRLLTLVPDSHICVVQTTQVVETVPEALERVAGSVVDRSAPVTLISGPSASSDIELSRVEGVHGPRNLIVLLVG